MIAYWWIRQSLKRAIDSKERMIKIPIHIIDRIFKALQVEIEFMKEHGRKPSKTELAEVMGLTVEQLLALVDCNSIHISLDELVTDDGNSLLDLIASPEVDIDFDGASEAWHMNKKRLANGCYEYICGVMTKTGRKCCRKPTSTSEYCSFHSKPK